MRGMFICDNSLSLTLSYWGTHIHIPNVQDKLDVLNIEFVYVWRMFNENQMIFTKFFINIPQVEGIRVSANWLLFLIRHLYLGGVWLSIRISRAHPSCHITPHPVMAMWRHTKKITSTGGESDSLSRGKLMWSIPWSTASLRPAW